MYSHPNVPIEKTLVYGFHLFGKICTSLPCWTGKIILCWFTLHLWLSENPYITKESDLEVNGHRCWLSQCGGKPRWSRCVSRKTWLLWHGYDPIHLHFSAIRFSRTRFQIVFNGNAPVRRAIWSSVTQLFMASAYLAQKYSQRNSKYIWIKTYLHAKH